MKCSEHRDSMNNRHDNAFNRPQVVGMRAHRPKGNFLSVLRPFAVLIIGLLPWNGSATETDDTALLNAMTAEMTRAFAAFEKREPTLYYLACGVTDTERLSVSGDFGALTGDQLNRQRALDIDARCGSYRRDHTHPLPGHTWDFSQDWFHVPLDNDPLSIRMCLWRAIESEYRKSAERFAQVQALDITKAALRDKSDDFSTGQPEQEIAPRAVLVAKREEWRDKVKRYTLPFRQYPHVYNGSATFSAVSTTRSFVNSEGTRLQFSQVGYHLMIMLTTRADDGLDMPLYQSYFAWEQDGLPSDGEVMTCVTNLAALAESLRMAPLVDPYSGPAILEGEAAAVFLHEVLGHRLEGHRQKDEKESQTFKGMLGKPVMPEFLTLRFNPCLRTYKGLQISGYYSFDEEGVRGECVVAIEKGVLKNFLMSRSPIEHFPKSNGHGRAAPGMHVVSRQSNLILECAKPRPAITLRNLLQAECRKQNKPYGLLFAKVEGGFTMTGRVIPNAFNVMPLVVYRLYTDGRPDELVRGVDIIGTPLLSLTKIIAAGDALSVFNGFCGAESGGVPVGAVSPSLLLGEIEVQKKEISRASAPVLPPPDADQEWEKEQP